MDFLLLPVEETDLKDFKRDMQEAFQKGAEGEFDDVNVEILPDSDIEKSLSAQGAAAYKAVCDGEMVGGAIVVINKKTQHNHLDFLYVKYGYTEQRDRAKNMERNRKIVSRYESMGNLYSVF